jgi:hypothetical protein
VHSATTLPVHPHSKFRPAPAAPTTKKGGAIVVAIAVSVCVVGAIMHGHHSHINIAYLPAAVGVLAFSFYKATMCAIQYQLQFSVERVQLPYCCRT